MNSSPASVPPFFTTLPILESKNKGNQDHGCGPRLPSLVIFQNGGSKYSWSALLSFSKQCKKKHMFLAQDWDAYKYRSAICLYSSTQYLQFWSLKQGWEKHMTSALLFLPSLFSKRKSAEGYDVRCSFAELLNAISCCDDDDDDDHHHHHQLSDASTTRYQNFPTIVHIQPTPFNIQASRTPPPISNPYFAFGLT